MYSRWFNITVVLLWLATMSWLVRTKVLPLLEVGEPPSMAEIVQAQVDKPPVGWEILIDGKRLGWAITETKLKDSGMRDVRGRVYFKKLPLCQIMPDWMKPFSKLAGRSADELTIDARSVLTVDSLGQLLGFESSIRLKPLNEVVGISGLAENGKLKIKVRSVLGNLDKSFSLPRDALPSDFFSPQTELPGLRDGRTWTIPVYSPLMLLNDPVKIIRATVEGKESIPWDGSQVKAWVVAYYDDAGIVSNDQRKPQAKVWVHPDGSVLKQQSRFSSMKLTFIRMTERQADDLVEAEGRKWWVPESGSWVQGND